MRIARLLILITVAAGTLAAADSRRAFSVGVLRRDGIIIPFGSFDGRNWVVSWPDPDANVPVPIALSDVPKRWWGPTPPLADWQAWIAGRAQTIHVTQPDLADVQCMRQIGLHTDYKSATPGPPQATQPYPKDGLVIAPPRPVEAIEILRPDSVDARALLPYVLAGFNLGERQIEDSVKHPIPRVSREGILPTIEAIYAFGTSPRTYYLETSRQYHLLGDEECEAIAYGGIWLGKDEKGLYPLSVAVDLLSCDRKGATYMLPLGIVRADKRLFWLGQGSGLDHERYFVVEIKKRALEMLVRTVGGTC